MKLDHIVLRNFRKYEHARFNFHTQFTVIIGANGAGKTSILDALAIMLNTYFLKSGIQTGIGGISSDDVRFICVEKGTQIFREPQAEVYLTCSAQFRGRALHWRRDKGDRGGQSKELVQQGMEDRDLISQGGNSELPLLLYYGAGRLWDIHRKIQTEKPGSQLDAYKFCLDPKSDHKSFEKWFKKLSLGELQKGYISPALQAVRTAVLGCIPGANKFYHDAEEDQIMLDINELGLTPFNYLSDGYRNMVAMVADIAHRASRLNPHHEAQAAINTHGVVLIDEIDLHLHPRWQRQVVRDLQKVFPNLQFIATTHSPFILQSLDPGEVIDLNQSCDVNTVESALAGVAAPGPANEFSHRSIEDITEDVMGIPVPQRSEAYQRMYETAKQYYALLEQSKAASSEEKQKLKQQLDELSSPFSDNVAYHAFLEMERLATGLGNTEKS